MSTETEALAYDHIVEVALEHGFKLKPQVDGRMALNDYVIDFARAVYDIGHAAAKAADVGEPVAMVQCHGSAEHPLYTADGLRELGIEPAGRDKRAVLYRESQFAEICQVLVLHLQSVVQLSEATA